MDTISVQIQCKTRIRVVNAFRHGVDSSQIQQAASNQNIQRVLQRQASLGKRSSLISSSVVTEDPKVAVAGSNGNTTVVASKESKVSSSHTETAVWALVSTDTASDTHS